MSERKTWVRFFTIADYEEEEQWLRAQHKSGWKLVKTVMPCFYIFERCTPEDVVYRLDYRNTAVSGDYLQIFRDYGWEYFNSCMGWLYFRKSVAETDAEQDSEIFSDDVSRLDMLSHVINTRMLPLLLVFLCCLLPNFLRSSDEPTSPVFIAFAVLMLLYLYLFAHCGRKLRRLRKKYGGK